MPCGRVMTQTRARRRQSDAKWRAGVAMCYSIMKNAVPNQKKLGRRKVSKALTIKETERHIINLEKKLKELIDERAPMLGKTVMMKTENENIIPASLEDIRHDFSEKQHSLFICSSHSGKKRFTVPPDIESNLQQMRQLTSDVFIIDEEDYKSTYPPKITSIISTVDKIKPTVNIIEKSSTIKQSDSTHNAPGTLWSTAQSAIHGAKVELLTPVKEKLSKCARNIFTEKGHFTSTPLKADGLETEASSQSSMHLSEGFTPIKLPYGLDRDDPMLILPETPSVLTDVFTPYSVISVQKTPVTPASGASGIMTIDYFDINHDIQQGLLCSESIDSVDYCEDLYQPTEDRNTSQHSKNEKSKCRRRLDRDYESEQTVPLSVGEENSLDLDGYLLFHKHNSTLLDPGFNNTDKDVTIAKMWNKLEPDYKVTYSKMAALEQSEDSNDLSDDLLGIDLRPFHKEQHDIVEEMLPVQDDTQQVPCFLLSDDVNHDNKCITSDLQFIDGFEDLGVFYHSQNEKNELSQELSDHGFTDWDTDSQVVPQM